MYYLLTKQHVYNFPREPAQQLLMILQEPPVRIDLRRASLPKKLADIIQKALSRSPGDRFSDISSFQKELRKVGT